MTDVPELLRRFADGEIPRHELRAELVIAALDTTPADLAVTLPADLLDELHRDIVAMPSNPDDVRIFRSACCGSTQGWKSHWRERSHRWHRGALLWRVFLQPVE